jgi:steroid 5-alpha reductase family enzyme
MFLLAFLAGAATGKHRLVDAVWGPAFAVVALVGYLASAGHGDPARRALVLALTAVWGVRLGGHIAWRGRGKPEDPRYEKLLSQARGSRLWFAFTRVYLLQAVLVWILSLPIQAAAFTPARLGPLAAAAVALWATGVFFEAVGDFQLARFKQDPANKGRLMDRGLWHYTRHPNYFGDACVGWGLFLLAAGSWGGAAAVVAAPIAQTLLLTAGSGMRLADRHMAETRPEYAAYAARTSGFVPYPPKRARRG